jgi:hypothetical protein
MSIADHHYLRSVCCTYFVNPGCLTEQCTGPSLAAGGLASKWACSDALRKSALGPVTAGVRPFRDCASHFTLHVIIELGLPVARLFDLGVLRCWRKS